MSFWDAGNIISADFTDSKGRGRDRGYYRMQRQRKIQERAARATRMGFSVDDPGRLSKSSGLN
jgi:hypothetical protein